MKLKILPPTLRINNRYLFLDIKSESKITKDELILTIWNGCIRFYGECETSNFNLWLMRTYDLNPEPNKDYFHKKAILRCQRNHEDKVRGSLATLSNHKGKKIAINTMGISGTIASALKKFIN